MSEPYPHRTGTEEDLLRAFGPDGLLIGLPVEASSEETPPPAEEEQSASS